MAYASGTCTDWIDMLRKLRDYAAGIIDPATDPEITAGQKVVDVAAVGTLTTTGNFANGDTVTLDAKVYTFQTTLTNVNGNVHIGASAAASITNLIEAVTLGAGSGTDYAAATTLHPTVTASSGGSGIATITAKTGGNAGNSIATTETSANASFGAGTLLGGYGVAWTKLTLGGGMTALPGSGFATDGEFYLQGPGSDPADAIIVGFQTYRNAGNSVYGVKMKGYSAYDNTLTFDTMPGAQSTPSCVALANATFNCWFWVNNRRIMALARIGTVDVLLYAGFVQQFGTRGQYPYPLMVAGSVMDTTFNTNQNNFGQSCLPDPAVNSCWLRWIDGTWQHLDHYTNNNATRSQARSGNSAPYQIWPQRDVTLTDSVEFNTADNEDYFFANFSSTNRQMSNSEISAYAMFPCIILKVDQLVGQLDGIYVAPGLGLNSGDTLNDGTYTYDVFKNTWRNEAVDFYAIRRV